MRRFIFAISAASVGASLTLAQGVTENSGPKQATYITDEEVKTVLKGAPPAIDQQLKVVDTGQYNVGVGNGRGSVISRGGDFGNINNNRAWLANVFIRPNSLYALQVGGSVYRDEVNPLTGPPTREWIQSAHIVWHKENPEFIAEFANASHRSILSSETSHSQAWYLQTAFRLPWNGRAWKPYYRFEYTHVPNSDTLFRAVPTFNASTGGVRYDLTTFAALKFELRRYNRRNLPDISGAFTQVSFTF